MGMECRDVPVTARVNQQRCETPRGARRGAGGTPGARRRLAEVSEGPGTHWTSADKADQAAERGAAAILSPADSVSSERVAQTGQEVVIEG